MRAITAAEVAAVRPSADDDGEDDDDSGGDDGIG